MAWHHLGCLSASQIVLGTIVVDKAKTKKYERQNDDNSKNCK